MNREQELKPCPFCGGTSLKSGGDDKHVGYWCLDCGAAGPNHYNSRFDWNTRAALEPAPKVTEEAVRYYARTLGGRQRLKVTTDEEAIRLVETNPYYKAATKEVVKEARTIIFTGEPSGVILPAQGGEG